MLNAPTSPALLELTHATSSPRATLEAAATDQDQAPEALQRAAEQFEAIFIKELLSYASPTTPGDAAGASTYRDMHQQALAEQISSSGERGFGIAQILMAQWRER